jgi:integrase
MTMESPLLNAWLNNIANENFTTAQTVKCHMKDFEIFVKKQYGLTIEQLLQALLKKEKDAYDVFVEFVTFLKKTKLEKGLLSERVLRYRVKAIRHFLETHDVDINNTKFRNKVKMPRAIEREKVGIEKDTARQIIQECENPRLKAYVMFLAATGWRPREVLALRWKDIDFDSNPAIVKILGENTKMKRDRHIFLTTELKNQLFSWKKYNYRERTITHYNSPNRKFQKENIKPVFNDNDLVFAHYHKIKSKVSMKKQIDINYHHLFVMFDGVRKRLGLQEQNITFYSFRRLVYTTIDGLGQNQFAEYFIGHRNSNYWAKPESEKVSTFIKIEPYLTFLDITSLEAKGADNQTRIDQLQAELHKERAERERLWEVLYQQGIIKKEK